MKRYHLWVAIALLASASAVVRKLAEIGAANPIDGRNPISFCNVLFAGNLVALVVLYALQRGDWDRERVRAVRREEWIAMLVVALLSVALAPALIFTALEKTSVTSVVLLGRIEPPLVLALAIVFLGEKLDLWGVAGATVALVGVAASLLLQPMMDALMFGRGEIYALAGAVCLALGTTIAKARLGDVPLGIVTTVRMAVGTVVMAGVVMVLFGPVHFIDIFAPVLWKWMLLYGALVVAAGQMLWFSGLRRSTTVQVTLATSLSPVIAIAAAAVILGETPMRAQWTGGAVILAGIAIGAAGAVRNARAAASCTAVDIDSGLGLKGI